MEKLQKELEEVQDEFASVNEDFMKRPLIQKLKPGMQETIRACWDLSKKNNKKSLRYTKAWILECLLLRIKSRKAYQHLRDHDILPLPCLNTINKYIKHLKPSFGFDPTVFAAMKTKNSKLPNEAKDGKLSQSTFHSNQYKFACNH